MSNELVRLPHFHSGKVRDTYEIPGRPDLLLPIASDRVSTFNVTHLTEIPDKGQLLTALTVFWTFEALKGIETHLVAYGKKIYDYLPPHDYPDDLHLRAIVVKRLHPDKYEFVWRRYLLGSLWSAYNKGDDPYRLSLPPGLAKLHRFEELLFTPTDKSETDDPQPSELLRASHQLATNTSHEVVGRIERYLAGRGITLLDMKVEMAGGVLIDEWGTGDCSRMAKTEDVEAALKNGTDPHWLDKEEARQITLQKWDGPKGSPLEFSFQETARISDRYHEAFELITGMNLTEFQQREFN